MNTETLILTQEERSFRLGPYIIICRTLQPSEHHGGWPGNKVIIREWSEQTKTSGAAIPKVKDPARLRQLEALLPESDRHHNIEQHHTLGKVTTP